MKNYKLLSVAYLAIVSCTSIIAMDPVNTAITRFRQNPADGNPAIQQFQSEARFQELISKVDSVISKNTAVRDSSEWLANMVSLIYSKPDYQALMMLGRFKTQGATKGLFDGYQTQLDKILNKAGVSNIGALTVARRTWKVGEVPAQPLGPVPATVDEAIQQAEDAAKAVVQAAAGKATQTQVDKIKAIGTELQKAAV